MYSDNTNINESAQLLFIGIYINIFIYLVHFLYKTLKKSQKVHNGDAIEFQLKTDTSDEFSINLKYITGSFIVSLNEISERSKKVMKNGALSVYIISVASEEKHTLQGLTCIEGFHKERLKVSLKDNKMKIEFAPMPRDDINENRNYQIKFNEL